MPTLDWKDKLSSILDPRPQNWNQNKALSIHAFENQILDWILCLNPVRIRHSICRSVTACPPSIRNPPPCRSSCPDRLGHAHAGRNLLTHQHLPRTWHHTSSSVAHREIPVPWANRHDLLGDTNPSCGGGPIAAKAKALEEAVDAVLDGAAEGGKGCGAGC